MWLLKKLSDGTTKYLISENKSYTIGRKNCDILLEQDPSISRKHCTIYIAKQSECPFTVNTFTGVWIVDEQSKYGTYLRNNNDWIRINSSENRVLSYGSVIKFGLMENVWSLEFKPLIACASGIPVEQKKKLESTLKLIDGVLSNSWSNQCSLIIVKEITLTVKVVLALIHGVPIVTSNYLQKVVECVINQAVLPNHEDYRPEMKEILLNKSLVSLNVNKNRKELFKGLKFIIPTKKQLEILKEVIISAGGDVELLSCNGDWKRFAEDNVVMIQLPLNSNLISEELRKSIKEITSFLKNNYGRRIIPESEIAQAVAYASIEKFCNPANTWVNIQIGEKKDVHLGSIIVEETPLETEEIRHSSLGIIPCSATIDSEPSSNEPVELQPSTFKNLGSQSNVSQKLLTERKRTPSTNLEDNASSKKKARSERISSDEGRLTPKNASFVENENLLNNPKKSETQPDNSKKNQKMPSITNYFQKQSNPLEENTAKVTRQSSSDFWNCDIINNFQLKRKVSIESDDSSGNQCTKKPKLTNENVSKRPTPEFEVDTPREIVEVVERNNSCEKSVPFPPIKKTRNIEKENNFSDFFGKEKADAIDDLNNTIFSLNLIPPAYLKEDGSLIDPPSEPVNVKRFKKLLREKLQSVIPHVKGGTLIMGPDVWHRYSNRVQKATKLQELSTQKLLSSETLNFPEENEDEILSAGWIEPHSNRHKISFGN